MKSKEFIVGLFAVIAIVLLYFGFNFLKGIDFFQTTAKYYAVYTNVDNLTVSNPVKVNGFAVGRVSQMWIQQNKGYRVVVEIDIDSKIKLGDSTRAILDSELLGGNYLFLSIGSYTNPLKPGDTLKSEIAKGMFDVLTETAEPLGGNLQLSLRKFNTAIESMTRNSQRLDTILHRLQTTPGILNRTLLNANSKMDQVATGFNEVTSNINGTLNELKPTLKNFKVMSDSLKRLELNKTILKTQQALTQMNETLAKLKKGDNTASKLLTEDTLYVNLNRLLVRLDSLAAHMNSYPDHFFAPLGKSHKKVMKDLARDEEARKKASSTKTNP